MYTVLYPVNELKIGGAEQQLLELVRGLDKQSFRPIVAPLYAGGPLDHEFRAIPGGEVLDLARRGKYDPSPLWRVGAALCGLSVDIIQPFLSPATFFGLMPAILAGTRVKVVTERCGVRLARGLGYKAYCAVEDRMTRFADVVVANSFAGRDLLLRRGIPADKVRVIYNGIDGERLEADTANVWAIREQLQVPEGGRVVGILASLTRAKGHDALLRAAAALRRNRPELRWSIIGDGPLRAELEALAASLDVRDRVVFFGNQRRVGDFLAACDVLVSCSSDNEGCSNSILEAMAVGVPVVATDVGGNRELIQDGVTGRLVPPRDPTALALAIDGALADPFPPAARVGQARAMVESRFGIGRMVGEYETLYEELLDRRPGSATRAEVESGREGISMGGAAPTRAWDQSC